MYKLIDRLRREPILTRAGLAAVLHVLVVAGVIDVGASAAIETAVVTAVNAVLLLSARQAVTPVRAPSGIEPTPVAVQVKLDGEPIPTRPETSD